MTFENNEIDIEKDECNKLLKRKNNSIINFNTNIIPDKSSNDDSEEIQNIKKRKPNIFKQFSIPKIYWITLAFYSILYFTLPFISFFNKRFYKYSTTVNDKIIRKSLFIKRYSSGTSRKKIYIEALIPMIYYCFIGPFVEEFLFRWLIFGLIKQYGQKVRKNNKSYGNLILIFAFIFSSILFSFGHFYMYGENHFIDITYYRKYFDFEYFAMGLIFAWIYYHYGYILITILIQFLYNIIETGHIFYMFSRDCYDSCGIYEVFYGFPIAIFSLLILIIVIIRFIYKISKSD